MYPHALPLPSILPEHTTISSSDPISLIRFSFHLSSPLANEPSSSLLPTLPPPILRPTESAVQTVQPNRPCSAHFKPTSHGNGVIKRLVPCPVHFSVALTQSLSSLAPRHPHQIISDHTRSYPLDLLQVCCRPSYKTYPLNPRAVLHRSSAIPSSPYSPHPGARHP